MILTTIIVVKALATAELLNAFTQNFDINHPDGQKSQMFFFFIHSINLSCTLESVAIL